MGASETIVSNVHPDRIAMAVIEEMPDNEAKRLFAYTKEAFGPYPRLLLETDVSEGARAFLEEVWDGMVSIAHLTLTDADFAVWLEDRRKEGKCE